VIEAPAGEVWEAVRDVGRPHTRLTPGVLAGCEFDGASRVVTFANGAVARELIVSVDEGARRVAYAVVEGRPTHHNASMQVFAEGERAARLVWTTDFLPDSFAEIATPLIEAGSRAMQKTLGRA
jgi:hypothetical protein